MNTRRLLMPALAVTVLLTLWLAWQDEGDDDTTVTARRGAAAASTGPTTAGPTTAGTPRAGPPSASRAARIDTKPITDTAPWSESPQAASRAGWAEADGQALAAWGPPPTPAPPVAAAASRTTPEAPPPPQAPPMPYTLIGQLEDNGQVMALIAGPLRTFTAKAGDVLDGQWRIDSIQPNTVSLTWLPANVGQTLAYKPS